MHPETLQMVKSHDYDRYLMALVGAGDSYAKLSLLALDIELARISAQHSDAMLAQIKLAWWQENLEKAFADPTTAAKQPTLQTLVHTIISAKSNPLSIKDLEPLIEARFQLLEQTDAIDSYADMTSGTIASLWNRLDRRNELDSSHAQLTGKTWGIIRFLKALDFQIAHSSGALDPQELIHAGIPKEQLFKGSMKMEENLKTLIQEMVANALTALAGVKRKSLCRSNRIMLSEAKKILAFCQHNDGEMGQGFPIKKPAGHIISYWLSSF